MAPRLKKFLGMVLLLPGLAAYFAGVVVLADSIPEFWLAKFLYFAIAGIAWAFPTQLLMRWMNAEPARKEK